MMMEAGKLFGEHLSKYIKGGTNCQYKISDCVMGGLPPIHNKASQILMAKMTDSGSHQSNVALVCRVDF